MSKEEDIQKLTDKLISRDIEPAEAAKLAKKWLSTPKKVAKPRTAKAKKSKKKGA